MNEESWGLNISIDDIEAFSKKHGAKPTKLLMAVLGKNHSFFHASQTEVGKELLKDLMNQMDNLMLKIVNDDATEEDKIGYRVRREIFTIWCEKINNYYKHAKKLKGVE